LCTVALRSVLQAIVNRGHLSQTYERVLEVEFLSAYQWAGKIGD